MTLTCPECKNTVDLSSYPVLEIGHIVECNHCGITLEVSAKEGDTISTEIVDEGK